MFGAFVAKTRAVAGVVGAKVVLDRGVAGVWDMVRRKLRKNHEFKLKSRFRNQDGGGSFCLPVYIAKC